MANDVKRMHPRCYEPIGVRTEPPTRSARLTLLACVGALAVLLTQLPGPAEALEVLTDATVTPTSSSAPLAAVQSILLTTAGLLTWLIAGWVVGVLGVGLIARLPGRPGWRARRLLPRIAPGSVGRLVFAAVGVSLIAGTAACAAPGTSGPAAGGTTIPSATSTAPAGSSDPTDSADPTAPKDPTGPADPTDLTAPTGPTGGSFTIDWPAPTQSPAPATIASSAPITTTQTAPSSPTSPSTSPPTSPSTSLSTSPSSGVPPTPTSSPTTIPPEPAPAVLSPDVPATAGPPPSSARPAEQPTAAETFRAVTVRSGDSLWRIAAHSLGPNATDTEIDNAWRAWYFANLEVIGDDPDTILPGQQLAAPGNAGQVRP
jgi:hypothetical protein